MQTIKIEDATAAQLIDYAAKVLGITIDADASAAKCRGIIAACPGHGTGSIIEIDDTARPGRRAQRSSDPARPNGDDLINSKVTVVIHTQDDGAMGSAGKEPVFLNVNGTAMLIERGVDSEIPYIYYHALDNAKKTLYDQDRAGNMIKREVHTYPFSVRKFG